MKANESKTWDIFCRVIDNYGDIGVCWRLARQLANEYPFHIRLWVDELIALKHIWPATRLCGQQLIEAVEVRTWSTDFDPNITPADVVVEAFACELPDSYLQAMKMKGQLTHWFNLEYLSAEDWVEGCHGLASMHPQLGLKKTFFFPGVSHKTGGLLLEKNLFAQRDRFEQRETEKLSFLKTLGVEPTRKELIVSLFGYENTSTASLINSWIDSETPVLCLVPPGKILPSINNALQHTLKVGDCFAKGSLRLHIIPFLNQTDYDYLLWSCDINFVRGEDSFVRAQWAAKPFIWHIYPQDDYVHMIKLNAFLDHYMHGLDSTLQSSIAELWHRWNRGEDCYTAWQLVLKGFPEWQKHSRLWCQTLNSLGDLASNMVRFCK